MTGANRRCLQRVAFEGEEEVPRTIPLDDGGTILIVTQAALDELSEISCQGIATRLDEPLPPEFCA